MVVAVFTSEAEFLDVIRKKRDVLLAIHSHLTDFTPLSPPPPPPSKSGLKLVCNCKNYAQKPQRNCTFMNSASVLVG
jgi:hypothetical protein